MKRHEPMEIDTSKDFWKLRLYKMRMKSWTINCLVTLISLAWVGPFGLKCLFGVEDFKYDEYVDGQKGTRIPLTRPTFIGVFKKVLEGIKKSREDFERTPDRGLLGKNISRYYNYIECYFFRLLLVGIIGTLILYPILIVVLSLLCTALILTFWAWVPIIMIVCYLFNILVFQFESSYIPRGVIIRSVPMLTLLFILVRIVAVCLFAVFLVIMTPVVSGLYIMFLMLQRGFRTLTDLIMLVIFKKLGRTPSHNTAIAKKISGPGMSRNYFFSINEEDVYVLTQAALEELFFNKLVTLISQKIEEPLIKFNNIMCYILSPFGYNHTGHKNGANFDFVQRNRN